VPHPFHVLCEKGGKPRSPPSRNSENALEGFSFSPVCCAGRSLPSAALAAQCTVTAGCAAPGIEPKEGIDYLLQKAIAKDALDFPASALLTNNLFPDGTRFRNILREDLLNHLL
jgi:hypothetical protein